MGQTQTTPAVDMIYQQNKSTCWLASCRMMYKWKNTGYTPIYDEVDDPYLSKTPKDEVLAKLVAAGKKDPRVDVTTWVLTGIDAADTVPLAKAMEMKWGGGGELEAWQFSDAIGKWGPMLAIGQWNTYAHVIVVTGAETTDDTSKKSMHKLEVNNPWPGEGKKTPNVYWFNGGLGAWKGVNGQYMHW